jgi:hypothetical protein
MLNWFKSNHQALTAIGAMVVGLAALFIAWDQARVMRAQQHGAAYPVLQIDGFVGSGATSRTVGITVSNNGVGPALIESVTVQRDGQPVADFDDADDLLHEGHDVSWASLTGRALAPGANVTPLSIRWSTEDLSAEAHATVAAAWDRYDVQICYCSVFDRCWQTFGVGGAHAERVRQCPVAQDDIFEAFGESSMRDENP